MIEQFANKGFNKLEQTGDMMMTKKSKSILRAAATKMPWFLFYLYGD